MTCILEVGSACIGIPYMNAFPVTRRCDTLSIRRPGEIVYRRYKFCFTQDTLMRMSTIRKDVLPSAGIPYLDRSITSRGCDAAVTSRG